MMAGPDVLASDAVRLLLDRGRAVRPAFTIGPADAGRAAALCRRLDGLPLAIELAAAQLRNLSLEEVAGRVEQRMDALGGSRSVAARHRTMRASIEWSHEMLAEVDRTALRRLSVFAGRFSGAAAQYVVGDWEAGAPEIDVLGTCARLVDKSMLVAEPGPEGTVFRMLEIVRQFSSEKLAAAAETSQGRARHARWYHDLVPESRVWAGPEQPLWMDRLRVEIDNVHGALAWYLGEGWEPERALEMAGPMWWFWYTAGRVGEGRIWLGRVLAAGSSGAPGSAWPRRSRGGGAGTNGRGVRRGSSTRRGVPGNLACAGRTARGCRRAEQPLHHGDDER